MEEENKNGEPELLAGKFKSVDALVHAYGELEAEFTRRSQRLKALEEQLHDTEASHDPHGQEELPRAATCDERMRARIIEEFLQSRQSVPLMGAGGVGVPYPNAQPRSIREASSLALGYLRGKKQ